MNLLKSILLEILLYHKTFIIFAVPLIYLPILFYYPSDEGKCAYIVLWMCTYWTTEALPLAVTALLPCLVSPLLSLVKTSEIAKEYIKDASLLFYGGLMIAVSIERCRLHKRVALGVLRVVGPSARWVVLGFMGTSWFLSMWLSNTATTTMMVPLVRAIVTQLKTQGSDGETVPYTKRYAGTMFVVDSEVLSSSIIETKSTKNMNESNNNNENERTLQVPSKILKKSFSESDVNELKAKRTTKEKLFDYFKSPMSTKKPDKSVRTYFMPYEMMPHTREIAKESVFEAPSIESGLQIETELEHQISLLSRCLLLGIAYSANLGGMASLLGTSSNLVLKSELSIYMDSDKLSFTNWIIMATPLSFCIFICLYLWVIYKFLGKAELLKIFNLTEEAGFMKVMRPNTVKNEYDKLGPMSHAEKTVSVLFVSLMIISVTRQPGFFTGWGDTFEPKYISDTQGMIFISFLLFILPSRSVWRYFKDNRHRNYEARKPAPTLLDWKTVAEKMPWDIIFLLGGGFALARTIRESNLDTALGKTFESFSILPEWLIIVIVCAITAFTTELASNTATATIFLPIAGTMAVSIGMNPLKLMLPVCLASSMAFMLPVGTPPNTIAYTYSGISVLEMVKTGFVVSFIAQFWMLFFTNTWISYYMEFSNYNATKVQL